MFYIKNNNYNKSLLRNGSTIPFFYKKFLPIYEYIENIVHLIAVGKIANGLLHDIVNPLTSLILSVNMKNTCPRELEKSSKELSEFIHIVQMQIRNKSCKENFTLSKLINESCILLRYKSIINNVRIVTIFNEDFSLYGNKLSLTRVLMNLINNAIESYENCPTKNRDVVISVFKEINYINISVKDFGCGISNENRKKIFKYLYTNKKDGTGIGLYVSSKNIRKEFYGKIIFSEKEKVGSNFIVQIPLKASI
jgi:signal transduction histidine kinase